MKNSFLVSICFSLTLFLGIVSDTCLYGQAIDCSKIVHIYAATTTTNASDPSLDKSTLFTYQSADSYAQKELKAGMTYPSDITPARLKNKPIQLNGLALNPKDGYLYGFNVIDSNRLIKIDNTGKVVGVITLKAFGNLADNKFPQNTMKNYNNFTNKVGGACFAPSGIMYVATSTQAVNADGSLKTTGSATIWTITGLTTPDDNTDNYSKKSHTDDLADGGFGDLLVNINDRYQLFVAAVGKYGTNGAILKGIKTYRVNTSPWTDEGIIMTSSEHLPKNYAILGMSYNDKGDFVGLTSVQTGTRLLFTMDACGNIIEYITVDANSYTGDGTSIFPF